MKSKQKKNKNYLKKKKNNYNIYISSPLALCYIEVHCKHFESLVRESLNGPENMAQRKEKNGEKSPWGQCLTRPVPNGRCRSAFWLGRKTQKFSGTNQKPERPRKLRLELDMALQSVTGTAV